MAKQALGSGLGELLGQVELAYEKNLGEHPQSVVELSVDIIKPNPYQPRKKFPQESINELAQSIIEHGLLQPVLVYEQDGDYYLIAGERRLRASKIAKQSTIKAIIAEIPREKLRELAIIENIQRENLNPIDLAFSYKELIDDYNITHEELSKRLHISRTQITNTLRLLELCKYVQEHILEGKITQGHAKVIVGLSEDKQRLVCDSIIGQRLSVRETENIVKTFKNENSKVLNSSKSISSNTSNKPKNPIDTSLKELVDIFIALGISTTISKESITIRPKKEKISYLIAKLKC